MTHIRHVTLTTASTRDSLPGEAGADARRALRPVIEQALTGRPAAVPGIEGYTIAGGDGGRCIALTVYGPPPDQLQVLTVAVALHSRCGSPLWRRLHSLGDPVATDPEAVPPEPWVADLLHAGALASPQALEWTGDLSRCLAWTYWEMRQDG